MYGPEQVKHMLRIRNYNPDSLGKLLARNDGYDFKRLISKSPDVIVLPEIKMSKSREQDVRNKIGDLCDGKYKLFMNFAEDGPL